MKVYQPLVAEGYEWVNCHDDQNYETFLELDGSPRAERWNPIKVLRVRADEGREFHCSDFPWLGAHALVMRMKAVDALRDILDAHGEILPLTTDDDVELFAFNARTVDALDEALSSIVRFPGSNRIMHIQQVAFTEHKIHGLDIFRLPHRASPTYVSKRFVGRVSDTGLVGLEFNEAWSSD